jgi:hypothetical protein
VCSRRFVVRPDGWTAEVGVGLGLSSKTYASADVWYIPVIVIGMDSVMNEFKQ